MYYFHFLSFQAKRIKSSRKIGRQEAVGRPLEGRWEAVERPLGGRWEAVGSVLLLLLICKEAKQGH